MVKKLFVGSLPYSTTNSQLEELFSKAGKIVSVSVITDKFSGQGKGFAFVEMESDEDAEKAIKMFNNYNLDGRSIVVNIARPKEDRSDNFSRNRGSYQRSGRRW